MIAALLVLLAALSAGPPPTGPELERQARQIDTMLVAPCCFRQEVSVHQSAAAQEVKQDVRRRLAAGETQPQILDAYVARYGKHILAEPRAEGFDRLLYLTPFVMFIASIALVALVIRRVTRHGPVATAGATDAAPGDLDERLDDDLRDLE